ncbi:uncharacterized protein LOC122502245 [Leptopilina heterotoma]|uniref:uncharacterized protein LOC122502245 n=1 Tax=Leptopilina heterotoma TaxID=63436 RepID=UPI001CA9FD44|nr:uncharacterized protein LOC122502245 [Leptopilina heterotoma]
MKEGIKEDPLNKILDKYPREGSFRTEAPKVNPELSPALTEIAVKRDKHFSLTQKCVGSALISLGSAISMILDDSNEGTDRLVLIERSGDTGRPLANIFHQQTVCRKSFITPLMNKTMKPILEATVADEWLYGKSLSDQVKEAQQIAKACGKIKAPEKSIAKKPSTSSQGNWKGFSAQTQQRSNFQRVHWKSQPYSKPRTYNSQNRGPQLTQSRPKQNHQLPKKK